MVISTNKTPYKALYCIFLLVVVLSLGSISALEFDNVKSYDLSKKEITITNAFGLGAELSNYKLISNTEKCVEKCSATGVAKLYTSGKLFEDYNVVNEKGKAVQIKKLEVYIDLSESYIKETPIYERDCKITLAKNGTKYNKCDNILINTLKETKTEIIKTKYNGEILPIGTYNWYIEGEKEAKQSLDWSVGMFGISKEDIREYWAEWTSADCMAEGGDITIDGDYCVHTFSSGGDFNLTSGTIENATVLVVAGGGGGGYDIGGGGGAGGLNYSTELDITSNQIVNIGSGGANAVSTATSGTNGENSSLGDLVIAIGGGGGASRDGGADATTGGSGGGGALGNGNGASGIDGQGNDGGDLTATLGCGGGGGAGEDGYDGASTNQGGDGGEGLSYSINGSAVYYAGGGGGSGHAGGPGLGGLGGGGDAWSTTTTGESGVANTGGGCGGAGTTDGAIHGGSGIVIVRYYIVLTDASPTVTLNTPTNHINQTTSDVVFNWTAEDDFMLDNSTLYIDGVLNQTFVHGTSNYTSEQVTLTFGDGDYNWTVIAYDNASNQGTTDTRYFTIDATEPTVTINAPTNGTTFLTNSIPYNVTSNVTISDTHLDVCLFYNGTANNTVTCGNNDSVMLGAGDHTLGWYANDTFGLETYAETTININYYYHNASYTDPAVEQETYDFNLTVTATDLGTFNGTFYYNNTAYVADYSDNGTVGKLGYTIQTNDVGLIPFNFTYYVGGTLVNANYTHRVNAVQNLSVVAGAACPAGLSPALHYDFKNEQNNTVLNNAVDYIFRYGVTNPTLRTTSGSLTSTNFTVCINSTVWNDYSIGYGEIQYQPTGYSDRRYYTFSSDRLSNTTVNNTLYSLIAGSSTSFLFQIQEADLSVFDNVYLTLNRWYPDEDEYKVVEMSRTDDEGETVMKVEIEDVDYRVGVYYQNGTLIYLASPFRLVCIATPCTYSLIVPENAGASFENWKNLQVSLTFDDPTDIFTMVYNDPSQDTSAINLSVYRDTGMSELLICTDSATSYTGVLTCNVTGYTGMLRAVGFRTASPATNIITKIIQQGTEKLGKTPALFITMLVMILLVSIGIVSPILTVILSVLAFIPAMMFGIMPLPILLILAAMGFIVIHFMKRSVGN